MDEYTHEWDSKEEEQSPELKIRNLMLSKHSTDILDLDFKEVFFEKFKLQHLAKIIIFWFSRIVFFYDQKRTAYVNSYG